MNDPAKTSGTRIPVKLHRRVCLVKTEDAVLAEELLANRKLVVYCEKLWLHRADLAKWEKEARRTVRPMLVPFNLK